MFTLLSWFSWAKAGIWPIVLAYGSWGILIFGLALVAYFVPLVRKPALIGIVAIIVGLSAYGVGLKHGGSRVQEQTRIGVQQEIKQGEESRDAAEHAIGNGDLPPWVRIDPYNRANRLGQQPAQPK